MVDSRLECDTIKKDIPQATSPKFFVLNSKLIILNSQQS